jgi:hypothetical protein
MRLEELGNEWDKIWVMKQEREIGGKDECIGAEALNSEEIIISDVTIECHSDCIFATIDRSDFIDVIQRSIRKRIHEKLKFL